MTASDRPISVVSFAPRHAAAFRDFNVAWITTHWALEPKDLEALDNPQRSILDKGGTILMAEDDGIPVGCVALIPYGDDGTLELAKLAVAESHRGRKVGRLLMDRAIRHARAAGAPRLYLESNTRLTPAIRLYESVGFRRVEQPSPTPSAYARVDIAMVLDLLPDGKG